MYQELINNEIVVTGDKHLYLYWVFPMFQEYIYKYLLYILWFKCWALRNSLEDGVLCSALVPQPFCPK